MRAIALPEQGASPALTELPTPEPAPGEVLVKVRASSLNGFDAAVHALAPEGVDVVRHLAGDGAALAELLEQVPAAFSEFATGTLGKIAITVA